jgi:hypothetical protein
MYKLKVFRAVDEPLLCEEYYLGHQKVLIDYGVPNVTSGQQTWIKNPTVYCVIAYCIENNSMVGGIKVQISNSEFSLPIEDAIGSLDPRIYDIIKKYSDVGVGELCGLWNSKSVAGIGLSMILTRAAISIINQLKFKILIGICADYTLDMFTRVGFVIDRSLGTNGEFPYPNEYYKTKVLGILNANTLETAHEYDREKMLDLRISPVQQRMETGPKGDLLVDYNLLLK